MSQLATKLRLTHNHLTHMLTDTKIRALKPKAAAYRVADTNGSVIEIRPAGSKAWRYRYRFLGKASIVTLDEYPAMGLQAARAERDKLRAMLCGGANPAQVARTEKATQGEKATATFAAVGLELLAKRTKEGLVPGSVVRERRLIEKDLAMLADIPVSDVTAPILLAALRKLEQRGGCRDGTQSPVSRRADLPICNRHWTRRAQPRPGLGWGLGAAADKALCQHYGSLSDRRFAARAVGLSGLPCYSGCPEARADDLRATRGAAQGEMGGHRS